MHQNEFKIIQIYYRKHINHKAEIQNKATFLIDLDKLGMREGANLCHVCTVNFAFSATHISTFEQVIKSSVIIKFLWVIMSFIENCFVIVQIQVNI